MKTNRYLLGIALLMAGALPAFSQVSNDNEDEVRVSGECQYVAHDGRPMGQLERCGCRIERVWRGDDG